MSVLLRLCFSLVVLAPALVHAATLENPANGSFYSGIGVISGWKCQANGPLTVRFNDGDPLPLAYGNVRADVRNAGACPSAQVGFVSIMNWAELGDGTHTAVVYDDGVEFARSTFEVATTGEPYVTGAEGECRVPDFPAPGETMRFAWNEATQHLEMVGDSGSGGEAEECIQCVTDGGRVTDTAAAFEICITRYYNATGDATIPEVWEAAPAPQCFSWEATWTTEEHRAFREACYALATCKVTQPARDCIQATTRTLEAIS